jgi:hypothetical protein
MPNKQTLKIQHEFLGGKENLSLPACRGLVHQGLAVPKDGRVFECLAYES